MIKIGNIEWDDSFKEHLWGLVELLQRNYTSKLDMEQFYLFDDRIKILHDAFDEIIEGDLAKIKSGEIERAGNPVEADLKRVQLFEMLRDIVCSMMIDQFYSDRFFYLINSLNEKAMRIKERERDLYV